MGIYGTYGAFSGLGKPSIKLEFEDNDELLAFQQRMQEPGDGNDDPDDGGNFTPVDKLIDRLSRMVSGKPYLKATRGGEEPVEGVALTENEFYNLINSNPERYEDYLIEYNEENLERLFPDHYDYDRVRIYKIQCKSPFFYNRIVCLPKAALKKHFFKHGRWVFGFIKPTLQNPNIVFETDGEVNFVKKFVKDNGDDVLVIFTPVKKGEARVATTFDKDDIKKLWRKFKKGGSVLTYPFREYLPVSTINGIETAHGVCEIVDIRLPYIITENGAKSFVDGEKSLGAPGDTYIITDTRTRARKDLEDTAALKKYDIRKFSGEELQKMQSDDPLLYEQIKSDLQQQKTPIKQEVKTKEDWMQEVDEMLEVWKKEVFNKTTPQKLDEPGSRVKARYLTNLRNEIIKYFIDEIDKGNYERVSNIANVLGYKYADNERIAQTNGLISQFVGIVPTLPEGWRISKNIPKYLPKLPKGFVYIDNGKEMFDYRHKIMPAPKGLGKTANDALYNNIEILDYRGMRPTYRQLPSYDAFFTPPANKNTLKGFGLADTKKLIADICRNHYRECAAIARHLKADTKLQSAFNLWHWLHNNIRYEYDREGREEVRTPLRTWQDRHRGVDCDCLSVFAWCVLKCMGYDPAFELAAFKGKPAYSHIYINIDGIVIDRVWFVFNSRPPGVTKTELFKVGMLDNLGQLF